jgi:hypothetical protein
MQKIEIGKKGQTSIEFFVLFSIVIFSFLFLVIMTNLSNEVLSKKFRTEKNKEIAKDISLRINRIFISGNGSSTKFFVPQGYSIYYSGWAIYVEDDIGNIGSYFVFPRNITILKNTSEISIKNLGGDIIVE